MLAATLGQRRWRVTTANLTPAFEQARQDQDLTALVRTVRRWWFEADAWRSPVAQREFLRAYGPLRGRWSSRPGTQGDPREDPLALRRLTLFRWKLEDEAEQALSELPKHVRPSQADFMDAVVIVDPAGYGRYPGEPPTPLRDLCLGRTTRVS